MKKWKKAQIKDVINSIQWVQEKLITLEFEHQQVYVEALEIDMEKLTELIKD